MGFSPFVSVKTFVVLLSPPICRAGLTLDTTSKFTTNEVIGPTLHFECTDPNDL